MERDQTLVYPLANVRIAHMLYTFRTILIVIWAAVNLLQPWTHRNSSTERVDLLKR